MRTYLNQLQNLYNSVCKLINDNLRPNPKYAKCTLELEIAHKRNKAVFTICFYYQFIFFYDMFINKGPVLVNLANLSAIYFIWFILFLSSRHHPQIFKTLYSLLCMSFGLMIMNGGSESITYAFVNMGTLAILVQAVTGSYKHFVVQTVAQALLANTLYQKPLEEMLVTTAPEKILQYLTYSANLMLMIQSFIVILIHRSLAQAQEQGYILEQKKIEAENQKTFLLGFSHELRNLINSLTGNVKLASLENINVKAKEFLLNAEVCGELLLHLINNILDSGKAAIGELEINPAPTKTYETFEKIWAICSELIRRKNLRGSIKMSKNLPRTLRIDQHRLTQIFLNLVGNAIKFTEKGSIDILVEWLPDSQTVHEECFQPYPFNNSDDQDEGVFEKWRSFSYLKLDHFVLSTKCKGIDCNEIKRAPFATRGVLKMVVTDDGCGMSKVQTSRLFQKFMQVTTDSSKKKLGTGLGLFITKQLCDRMNGEVRVFSELGKGSSFMLCIPTQVVVENNQILNSQESFRTYAASANLKAMIVDDLACNHIILESFLNNLGIQVSSILMDGLQAYKKYLEFAGSRTCPQIIAMDLDMPVMDGKEASKKIREFEVENGLKPALLVIISGNCIESEIAECLDKRGRIRADAFLQKPIRIDDLTRVLSLHYLNC